MDYGQTAKPIERYVQRVFSKCTLIGCDSFRRISPLNSDAKVIARILASRYQT